MSPPRRPAAENNQVVRAHLARLTLPEFLSSEMGREQASLVTLSPSDSLGEASRRLAAARILSAPVIEPAPSSSSSSSAEGTFRGFFDVSDFLRAVVGRARETCPELLLLGGSDGAGDDEATTAKRLESLSLSGLLSDVSVRDRAHAAGEAWFRSDDDDTSMLDVVVSGFRATSRSSSSSLSSREALLSDPLSRPAHRVAVFCIEKGGGDGGPAEATATTADGPALRWRVRGVLSQSDVVRYIARRSEAEFEPATRQTLAELGFCSSGVGGGAGDGGAKAPSLSSASLGASSSPLVVLPAGTPAIAAFATMASRRASAVALVDEGSGELLACLTSSDLRGFDGTREEAVSALALPSAVIAAAVAAAAGGGSDAPSIWSERGPLLRRASEGERGAKRCWREVLRDARVVSATPATTLGETIRKAADARVHRVWVVDGDGKPVGVIGLNDMLRVLVQDDDEF